MKTRIVPEFWKENLSMSLIHTILVFISETASRLASTSFKIGLLIGGLVSGIDSQKCVDQNLHCQPLLKPLSSRSSSKTASRLDS